MRTRFRFGLSAAAAMVMVSLGAPALAADTVKIAVAGPLSGNYAQYGEYLKRSAELAAADINAAGGVSGMQIEIIAEDDQMDPRQAATVAQRLSARGDIVGVVGHFSSTSSLAAQPIYARNSIVMISPSSTSPDLAGKPNFFRTAVTDEVVSRQLADYAVETLGAKRIAVLYQTGTATITQAEIFEARARELGAEILLSEGHEPERVDFQAVMTRLAPMNPDLLFTPTFTVEASRIARQAREAGIQASMMGTDGLFDTQLLRLGGDATDGYYAAAFFHHTIDRPEARHYVETYQAKFGEYPEGYGANAYDAVGLIAWAVGRVGTDPAAIIGALEQLQGDERYVGVTGEITFQPNHNVLKDILVVQARNGEFELVD